MRDSGEFNPTSTRPLELPFPAPAEVQLELGDHSRVLDVEHEGKRYVVAGGPWRRQRDKERRDKERRDKERREVRIRKGEAAFCELKSYMQVLPVYHHRSDRVVNHVRICFIAYWLSARLSVEWKAKGVTTDVPELLRELQSIRMGYLRVGEKGDQRLTRLTQVPSELNEKLDRLDLLSLFSKPPKWATNVAK